MVTYYIKGDMVIYPKYGILFTYYHISVIMVTCHTSMYMVIFHKYIIMLNNTIFLFYGKLPYINLYGSFLNILP